MSADGRHLLTDVWTSAGVLVGVGLVALTGWDRLDPTVAMLVGVNILVTGFSLVRRSSAGLMDASLPAADQAAVDAVLDRHRSDVITFHAVRTRAAGRYRFVSLHLLVPGDWTVQQGHDLAEQVEAEIVEALPDASVTTHIEPIDDPASFDDVLLDSPPTDARGGGDPPPAGGLSAEVTGNGPDYVSRPKTPEHIRDVGPDEMQG